MSKETVISYIEDIAKRLHDPTQYGSASVMVGAGFSKNAISLDERITSPNWEELASLMYSALYPKLENHASSDKWEEKRIRKISGKNVLKLAEEYKTIFKRNKLDQFIEQNINDDKYMPGELHKMLLELNWHDVFTTNYDTLLERTTDKITVRKNYKVLTNQSDLPGSTNPRIIKLHGSIGSSKPYIICEEDYRTYPVKYAPFVNTVQQSMLETQLCLIGFSGDDPNFLNWLGWLRDNMGENCPQIYLCGIFHSMSEPERRTLESQNIAIIDLGELFDKEENYTHFDALKLFFDTLRNYGKEKKRLFKAYKYSRYLYSKGNVDKDKNIDEHLDEFINYSETLKNEAANYVLLPYDHSVDRFADDLNFHFKEELKLKLNDKRLVLLGNMAFLLRKLNVILVDHNARLIEKTIEQAFKDGLLVDIKVNTSLTELILYLLEMYRVDGEWESYDRLISTMNKIEDRLDSSKKSEIYIERAKYSISKFEYHSSEKYISKIEDDSHIELQIKKAGLWIQLGEQQKALDLLKKSSAALAQKSYSEDKFASLASYINLCARALSYPKSLGDLSDNDYVTNPYNIRKMFNDLKEEVGSSLLIASKRAMKIRNSFNPASFRVSYGTTPKEIQQAFKSSTRYILFTDYLALPTFKDHKDIYALSLMEMINSSPNPLWKWSSIIRTKDEKIIDTFFTRERIFSADKTWVKNKFDFLNNLLDCFGKEDRFNREEKISTQSIIIDVLSRLCIVLDNSDVIQLCEKLFKYNEDSNERIRQEVNKAFNRLEFCFNSEIMKHFLLKILESEHMTSSIINSFKDLHSLDFKPQLTLEVANKVINQIESDDTRIRDVGVSKAILIHQYMGFGDYYEKFAKAIWERTNPQSFPESSMYTILLWDILPHPDNINFTDLYLEFLNNPIFSRCVNGASISGPGNADAEIHVYINCFYMLSNFNCNESKYNVKWHESYFLSILYYVYEYMQNEKKMLSMGFDIMGFEIEGRKRFAKLSELVAMLATQAHLSNVYSDEINQIIEDIIRLLREYEIPLIPLETIKKIIKGQMNLEEVEKILCSINIDDAEEASQIGHAVEIILVVMENEKSDDWVVNKILELIKAVKYMDISNSRKVIRGLLQFIDKTSLLDEYSRNTIIKAFVDCFEKFDIANNEIDKDLLDAMYILSIVSNKYYKSLVESKIEIPDDFKCLVNKLKESKMKEVKYMWERVQVV